MPRRAPSPVPVPAGRPVPDWTYEQAALAAGRRVIAGADEVGRGAWAGPLVAAAVCFPPALIRAAAAAGPEGPEPLAGLAAIRDSKQLTPAAREMLDVRIRAVAAVGLGLVSAALCDCIGMGAANRLAIARAIRALPVRPDYLLLDAFPLPAMPIPQAALIRGDSRVMSIAAASIVAKVARDAILDRLHTVWPTYGFVRNKGYGTAAHAAVLDAQGPCPEHRRSFDPLRSRLAAAAADEPA